MARATLLIPIYFFSSIRAGVGKASIVANLAIFLNNLRQKVAIIDLDNDSPRKLKNSFPQSIILQEYADLCQIAHSEENRFQKNFYFTETNQISYFPAQKLSDPDLIFSDTSLRDFFIQLKASFDCVLINYPPGAAYAQKISELLAKKHLWRGSRPASLIVSMPDDKSLVNMDRLLQHNPALSYQLQENTFVLFNKVPGSPEDVNLSENLLSGQDLRKIFDLQQSYTITANDEFPRQRLEAWPTVLKPESLMHQAISGLYRLLTYSAESLLKQPDQSEASFQACLDGDLLEKLAPYLEKIHRACASRLFVHSSGIQVFLEEGHGSYRIRVRISGISQPLLGINTKVRLESACRMIQRPSPGLFGHSLFAESYIAPLTGVRTTAGEINQKKVYNFQDSFSFNEENRIYPEIPLLPNRERYPSPIIFAHDNRLPEVPSLSHVLGYTTAGYRKFNFCHLEKYCEPAGVTHFFIPPEFPMACDIERVYLRSFSQLLKADSRANIAHTSAPETFLCWPETPLQETFDLPDEFARNKPFVAEHDFSAREPAVIPDEMVISELTILNFRSESQIFPVPYQYCSFNDELYPTEIANQSFEPDEKFFITPGFTIPLNFVEQHWAKSTFSLQPLSLDCIIEDRKYRETATAVSMPRLQTEHFFEVKAGIGIFSESLHYSQPHTEHWQNSFATTAAASPQIAPIENFAISYAVKVPRSLTWEELLMDYSHPAPSALSLGKRYHADMGIFASDLECLHQTFFYQNFAIDTSEKAIDRLSNTSQKLQQNFAFFADELRNMAFKKIPEARKLSFDVFPAGFLVGNDSFKDHSELRYYKVDNLIDSSILERNFAPDKNRMLEIISPHSEVSALKLSKILNQPEVVIPELTPTDPEFAFSADLLPKIECNCFPQKFSADIFAGYKPELSILQGRTCSFKHFSNLRFKNSFDFNSPMLGIFSIRQGVRKFFSFPFPEISMHLINSPLKVSKQYELSIAGIISCDYAVSIDPLRIPARIPLRYRRLTSPAPAGLPAEVFSLRTVGSLYQISWKKSRLRIDLDKIRIVSEQSFLHELKRRKNYPMTLKAKTPFRSLLQKKINFFIRPPEVIETIYQHLIQSSKGALLPAMQLKDKVIETQISPTTAPDFAANAYQTVFTVNYTDQHLAPGKINLRKDRRFFPIVKPGFKDLMNLARQTNSKLNAIGQIISS